MKVLAINITSNGSTGNIMKTIMAGAKNIGIEYVCVAGFSTEKIVYPIYTHRFFRDVSTLMCRISGYLDRMYFLGTRKLIRKIKKEKPDIVHLHNIHGDYLNIRMLFDFLKKEKIPVVWTLHDCWSFTGKCPHFEEEGCEKWKTTCAHCPSLHCYPKSYFFDRTKYMFLQKRKMLLEIKNLSIVAPSQWLLKYCGQSFLANKPMYHIPNGINCDSFYTPVTSDFREKYGLKDKKIILGVAKPWSEKKGLNYFNQLAEDLDLNYAIVLVGITTEKVSKKIIAIPPVSIDGIKEIYQSSDIFLNLTLEDTFPTVNIEALCSGLPVITFDTGGCKEQVNSTSGIIVPKGDVEAIKNAIIKLSLYPLKKEDCVKQGFKFPNLQMINSYVALYKEILEMEKLK